jgi:hypothetical protein
MAHTKRINIPAAQNHWDLASRSRSACDLPSLPLDWTSNIFGGLVMAILWEFLTNHRHYWGVPHRCDDNANSVVMICYGCGKVKKVQANLNAA